MAPGFLAELELELDDGTRVQLQPGDIIGRAASARLILDDPRVSEAHAMLSLRHGRLVLLALRRLLLVEGTPVREVVVREDLEIGLAERLTLRVARVSLPERVLTVGAPGRVPARPLASVASLFGEPRPRVLGRFDATAPAHVWSVSSRWSARVGEHDVRTVGPGDALRVQGIEFQFGSAQTSGAASTARAGAVRPPLRIVAMHDVVEIHRSEHGVCTLTGKGAQLLSEVIEVGGPVAWQTIARELWPREFALDDVGLRRRWDVTLTRLRRRLEEAELPADLLRSQGRGLIHLVLRPEDEVVDRS